MTDDGRWFVGGALAAILGAAAAKRMIGGSRAVFGEDQPAYGGEDLSRQGDLFFGFDRPDYTHYVLLEDRILSAWTSFQEAKDYLTEDLGETAGDPVIVSRSEIRRMGIDPAKTASWWG
jgi:hypothetical protein